MYSRFKADRLQLQSMLLALLTLLGLLITITSAFAQGGATASATIVRPETIAKGADMILKSLSPGPGVNAPVHIIGRRPVLHPASAPRNFLILPASFTISGDAGYTYCAILPASVVVPVCGGMARVSTTADHRLASNGVDVLSISGIIQAAGHLGEKDKSIGETFSIIVAFN